MKIAILADIHGNYIALEKCMKYALEKNITTFLFLGDYVGELPCPERVMKMLYKIKEKYNCTFIRGNKENYWINYRNKDTDNHTDNVKWVDNNSTTGMLLYAYNHLTDKDIDFFDSLPITRIIDINGHAPFTICHGSPFLVNEDMIPGTDRIYEIMDASETDLIICGHTHRQNKTIHNNKVVLNPGSVGIPLSSEGKTQFLILESNDKTWNETFISLEYDVDKLISDMQKEKLHIHAPYWNYSTTRLLKDGKISNGTVLTKAMELCKLTTGECHWPHIPEEYWEQAIKELYKLPNSNNFPLSPF
ncbi:MAG: metallophosphoesterase family protein [Lachnospiraceae bacterium]|nr:metallophosphoesterase family protein [Lachnospiraceae bacterium]